MIKILRTTETIFDQAKPTLMAILGFEKQNHCGKFEAKWLTFAFDS